MQLQDFSEGSVFHEGERRMHIKLGVVERLDDLGSRMIRKEMPDQHREFFAMLRLVHLGAVDNAGHPWAIYRVGDKGFMKSPDSRTLNISSRPSIGEPQGINLSQGAKISVLGLEYETRRRNRMNGTIKEAKGDRLKIDVDQSYGNCPKYIQTRRLTAAL